MNMRRPPDVPVPTTFQKRNFLHKRWFSPPRTMACAHGLISSPIASSLRLPLFSDLVSEARDHAISCEGWRLMPELRRCAVSTYLASAVSKLADWHRQLMQLGRSTTDKSCAYTFARQAIPMAGTSLRVNLSSEP